MGFLSGLIDPQIERHLLAVENEQVLDHVYKHWMAVFWPILALICCIPVFVSMIFAGALFWLPLLSGLAMAAWALWRIHVQHMDRFVITNMRVFRVHGVFNQHLATMPINRILDISVSQSLLGQLFDYGHFVFETAAQDQGLRVIRFVGDPNRRDLLIQQIIQKAGLRARVSREDIMNGGA